jgi:hypothetical protein
MATKTKGTNAKIKELKGIKPEKVKDEELAGIQAVIGKVNNLYIELGRLEARKHQALHFLAGVNDELQLIQNELMEAYGTNDVNIQDGVINYPKENGETNS